MLRYLVGIVLWVSASTVCLGQQLGGFSGDLVFRWDPPPSREMTLLSPISFKDIHGETWSVPAGSKTDGASIPRVFWSVIGGPFDGPHRDAAVIHDYFCVVRTHSWKDTHRVFYEAMLARLVDSITAKIMYAAVYHFGPRWGDIGGRTRGKGDALPFDKQDEQMKDIKTWISKDNPSLEVIESRLDAL